jgi:hypothetical protein
MSEAVPPFPQYAFMAWCSVHKKDEVAEQFIYCIKRNFMIYRDHPSTDLVIGWSCG